MLFIAAIGVGILLIPFTVISIICLKKTKKTALNDGLLWASLFLIFHLAFIIAPAGILLAAYFDKGMNFVLIVIGSLFLVINSYYLYEKFIKKTFIVTINSELYSQLQKISQDENKSIKDIINNKIKDIS
ncbi:hypothetical protein SAMN02799632_03624 [Acinetobacter pittii]|uniref:hypothetical protein n=1 Tax=Acinetobacter sp. AOR43_HL TaxID=2919390 RepID=UPI0008BFAF75|nr:hypothetical protein [Acinetobacter sp. AOR43_HL]MDA3451477.1 hypothetical protein [Acinetobacter sp. AOR43_HL]SEP34220.1 hypothetical protein SAMN02799632_03624 [Acinetobacter pittii]